MTRPAVHRTKPDSHLDPAAVPTQFAEAGPMVLSTSVQVVWFVLMGLAVVVICVGGIYFAYYKGSRDQPRRQTRDDSGP